MWLPRYLATGDSVHTRCALWYGSAPANEANIGLVGLQQSGVDHISLA
jgi:hypothetical protein